MPSKEIIRLLAQSASSTKSGRRVRPKQFLNITSFELFICTCIKDRGMPEGGSFIYIESGSVENVPLPFNQG